MISLLGSLMQQVDTTLVAGLDNVVASMQAWAGPPLALTMVLFFTVQGIKMANGDNLVVHYLVPDLVRFSILYWLASDSTFFNYYVRDVIFNGIPGTIAGVLNTSGNATTSATAVGAALDSAWNGLWSVISAAWALASPLSLSGLVAGFAGLATAFFGGVSLAIAAVVYEGSRVLASIIVAMLPGLLCFGIFPATRSILGNAFGYVLAMVLAMVAAMVLLSIEIAGTQFFLAQATNEIVSAASNSAAGYATVEVMVALTIWFLFAGWAMFQVFALGHSLAGGISASHPMLSALAAGRLLSSGGPAAGGSGGGGGGVSAASAAPSYSLALASPSLSFGGGPQSAPPPPPPSISTSTRPLLS